jgi:hypothetical protein
MAYFLRMTQVLNSFLEGESSPVEGAGESNCGPEFFSVAGSPLMLAARHQCLGYEGGGIKKTRLRLLRMSFTGSVVVSVHDGQLACANG